MRKQNVVLIVLDTLREDFATGLEKLLGLGFVRLPNAFAPSVWTLPSHISMFTGALPSAHGIHESYGVYTNDLMQASRRALAPPNGTLLGYLKEAGYTLYGASANPMISPSFGFEFDHYAWFDHAGRVERGMLDRLMVTQDKTSRQKGVGLLRSGELSFLARRAVQAAVDGTKSRLKSRRLEKGSKRIVQYLRGLEAAEPFFLFVNLVEAHEPYWWGADNVREVAEGILGRPVDASEWRKAYPVHASLGVSRALEIVRSVLKYDPLIIVTSDHGQLLGEEGRLGHVYLLDDALVRVPLYVRTPGGAEPPRATEAQCSLAEIPKIVEGVVEGRELSVGRRYVVSESYGSHLNLTPYAGPADTDRLRSIYHRRARVFSRSGSVLLDKDTGRVESASAGLSEEEVKEHLAQVEQDKKPPPEGAEVFSSEESRLAVERLRDLGYE